MMPMDGTEVMNRGISLFLGRASDRHCSRLTLEIGTIKRTTASVAQYEEGAFNQHKYKQELRDIDTFCYNLFNFMLLVRYATDCV